MFVNKHFANFTVYNSRTRRIKECEIFRVLFLYEHEHKGRFSNLHCVPLIKYLSPVASTTVKCRNCSNSLSEPSHLQPTSTCSMLAIETLEKGVKYGNMFKVSNKDARTTSSMSFWCLYCQH